MVAERFGLEDLCQLCCTELTPSEKAEMSCDPGVSESALYMLMMTDYIQRHSNGPLVETKCPFMQLPHP